MGTNDQPVISAGNDIIVSALETTWYDASRELERVPVPLWNESVFRFFFVKALLARNPGAKCQTEWNQFDLLVQCESQNSVVEFKFYRPSIYSSLCGGRRRPKGGAGRKNFGEFWQCVSKLDSLDSAAWKTRETLPIHRCYLVLVFAHHESLSGDRAYRNWYDPLRPPPMSGCSPRLKGIGSWGQLRCRASENELFCKLFEVGEVTT